MSKTQETLDRLPENTSATIKRFKKDYEDHRDWSDTWRDGIRQNAIGYLNALNDTGFISDTERRLLFIYITL